MRVELAEIPTQEIRKTNILPFSTHAHTHTETVRLMFIEQDL